MLVISYDLMASNNEDYRYVNEYNVLHFFCLFFLKLQTILQLYATFE